jgi:hypothetical protein
MAQHKWHKEIKAWADGAEIEVKWFEDKGSDRWHKAENPDWNTTDSEYRIKPQPKEPQYLYVYHGKTSCGDIGIWFEKQQVPYIEGGYVGKIKLEDNNNGND